MTDIVSFQRTGQPAESAGIRRELLLVIPHFRHRRRTGQNRSIPFCLRTAEAAVHPLDVGHGPSHIFHGQLHPEFIIRFQQHTVRFPESLPHRTVSGLPEISAFRMFLMRPAGFQRDLHVRQRRAGQHAPVLLLLQMRERQTLPVPVQDVLAAVRRILHPRAAFPRLQEEMHLRIMPKRLEMPHPFNGIADSLFIYNVPASEGDQNAEPVFHHFLQDFCLHIPHELDVDLLLLFHPHHMKLRVLLFDLPEVLDHPVDITALRQFHPVRQHRLQHREFRIRLRADPLPRICSFRTGHRADHTGLRLLQQFVFIAGIQPDLVHLAFHIRQRLFYPQFPACHFEIRQPVALRVPGDLVNLGPECFRICRGYGILPDPVQEFSDPFGFQRRPEPAGEDPALCDRFSKERCIEPAGLQIGFQKFFITDGYNLRLFSPDTAVFIIRQSSKIHTVLAQPVFQLPHQRFPVSAFPVHLIYENKDRHLIPLKQLPEGHRMPLNPVRAADDQHRIVQHLQDPLHLRRKIHMPRRIQERDVQIFPREHRLLGEDRDPPLPLQLISVQKRIAVIHPAHAPDAAA